MIISLLQEKGGAGKTTIAINLARALKQRGYKTILVDSDPQGSVRDWHAARDYNHKEEDSQFLDVVGLDRPTIDKDVQKFKRDYDFIIIDGSRLLNVLATRTIICSDIVLIPVQPSPFDIWACEDLINLIQQRQEITEGFPKAAFVISRSIANTVICREVREILKQAAFPVLRRGTSQRVAYPQSASKGLTVTDVQPKFDPVANAEIHRLADEVLEFTQHVKIKKVVHQKSAVCENEKRLIESARTESLKPYDR